MKGNIFKMSKEYEHRNLFCFKIYLWLAIKIVFNEFSASWLIGSWIDLAISAINVMKLNTFKLVDDMVDNSEILPP